MQSSEVGIPKGWKKGCKGLEMRLRGTEMGRSGIMQGLVGHTEECRCYSRYKSKPGATESQRVTCSVL